MFSSRWRRCCSTRRATGGACARGRCPRAWDASAPTGMASVSAASARHRVLHALADLEAGHQAIRRHRVLACVTASCGCHLFEGLVLFRLLPPRPAPEQVHRAVHRDPVQPGAEARPSLEASELPVRLEKRLLDDVLGVLTIAGHAEGQPVDAAAVAVDQQAERVRVTAAGPFQRGSQRGGQRRGFFWGRHPIV